MARSGATTAGARNRQRVECSKTGNQIALNRFYLVKTWLGSASEDCLDDRSSYESARSGNVIYLSEDHLSGAGS
jgi:hypothetical protein